MPTHGRFDGPSALTFLGCVVGMTAAYAMSSLVSGVHAPAWIPMGVAIGLLGVAGPRFWPGVFMGALIWSLLGGSDPAPALVVAGAVALCAGLLALVLDESGPVRAFQALPGTAIYVGAALAACLIPAALLAWVGPAASATAVSPWLSNWLGHVQGAVVLAPAIILLAHPTTQPRRLAEAVAMLVTVATIGVVVFLLPWPSDGAFVWAGLLFIAIAWPACRSGTREGAAAMVVLAIPATLGSALGTGPFHAAAHDQAPLLTSALVIAAGFLVLILAAGSSGRRAGTDLLAGSAHRSPSVRRLRAVLRASPPLAAIVPLVVGTLIVASVVHPTQSTLASARFGSAAADILASWQAVDARSERSLEGLRGLVEGDPFIARNDFEAYVDRSGLLDSQMVRSAAFVRSVPSEDRAAFFAKVSRDPDLPASVRDAVQPDLGKDAFLIDYLVPTAGAGLHVADDLVTGPHGDAVLSAVATGKEVGSLGHGNQSVFVFLPVFPEGDPGHPDDRLAQAFGVVMAVYDVSAAATEAQSGAPQWLPARLLDRAPTASATDPGTSVTVDDGFIADDSLLVESFTTEMFGRTWTMQVQSPASLLSHTEQGSDWFTFLAAAGLSGALAASVYAFETSRQRAQDLASMIARAVLSSERQLATAERLAAVGSWQWHAKTGQVSWSLNMFRILGLRAGSVQARLFTFMRYVHPADRKAFYRVLERAIQEGVPFDLDHRATPRKGGVIWLHTQAQPVLDDDGEVDQVTVTAHDITARVQAEARTRRILDASPDAGFVLDDRGRILQANQEATRLLGRSKQELAGEQVVAFMSEGSRHRFPDGPEQWRQVASTAIGSGLDVLLVTADGDEVPIEATLRPFDAGGSVQIVMSIRDMTDRAREQETLMDMEKARAELERIRKIEAFRGRFMSDAAHELRTPLLPIRSELHLLAMDLDRLDADGKRSIELLTRNFDRMAGLVDDLLESARMQAGRLAIDLAPADLHEVVRHAVESFRPMASERKISLSLAAKGRGGARIDTARMGQVVFNLLSNALKFTPVGGVINVVSEVASGQARIQVRDTGIGIAHRDQAVIFDAFSRVSDEATSRIQGTGLGLSIARTIVELHGGRIWVESRGKGRGSAFIVELPTDDRPLSPRIDASMEAQREVSGPGRPYGRVTPMDVPAHRRPPEASLGPGAK